MGPRGPLFDVSVRRSLAKKADDAMLDRGIGRISKPVRKKIGRIDFCLDHVGRDLEFPRIIDCGPFGGPGR